MKKLNVLFAAFAVFYMGTAAVAAPWKLATIRPEGSAIDIAVHKFVDDVKKGTDGRIDIQIYPNSVLGDYTTVQELVSLGSVEMQCGSMSWRVDKRLSAFIQPYLVKDWETAKKNYSKGAKFTAFCEEILEKQNVKVLAYWPIYFGGIALTKDVANPLDTEKKNLKVRVPSTKQWEALADAFGFQATPLPFSEFFTAAQTGMVEGIFGAGAENHYVNFKDIMKAEIPINTHFECWPLIINKELYDGLSDADRATLDKAAADFEAERWGAAPPETESYLKKLEEKGIKVYRPTPEQLEHFSEVGRKATFPVLEQICGKKGYEEILATIVD